MAVKTILVVACCVLGGYSLVWAEPAWRASLGVSEEYNDNTREERHGEGDFVTSVKPSVGYRREGSRTLVEADYRGVWSHYAANTRDQEFNHDARGRVLVEAWEDFLFFDVSDTYRMVNRDTTRGEVIEEDSTINQVQQNVFSLSTYVTPRLGTRGAVKTGYAYSNVWYEDEGETKNIHTVFADLTYELTLRAMLLSGYSYTRQLADDGDLDRHVGYVGARYQYAPESSVFIKVGPRYTRYAERDSSSTTLFWDAGWTHDFGHVRLDVLSGVKVEDDPDSGDTYDKRFGTVRLTKEFQRTTLGLFATREEYEQEGDDDTTRRTYAGVTASHELSARLTCLASIARDLQRETDEDRIRWYGSLILKYALAEDLAAEAWYRYKDASNSGDDDDEYSVHRIGVQLTKRF